MGGSVSPLDGTGSPVMVGGSRSPLHFTGSPGAPVQPRSSSLEESQSHRHLDLGFQPWSPLEGRLSPGVPFQPWSSPLEESQSRRRLDLDFQPRSPLDGRLSRGAPFQPLSSSSRNLSQPSPIRYREGPLDYVPHVYCKCIPKAKAGRFISWSEYPGRRYYSCMKKRTDPQSYSHFLGWHDEAFPQYVTNLIGDLRDRVDELTSQVDEYEAKHERIQGQLEVMMDMLEGVQLK